MLIDHIHGLIRYWEREGRAPDVKDKLEGLAFSILSALDGSSSVLPAFDLVPCPHPTDKDYLRDEGENWFPSGTPLPGALHEYFHRPK